MERKALKEDRRLTIEEINWVSVAALVSRCPAGYHRGRCLDSAGERGQDDRC